MQKKIMANLSLKRINGFIKTLRQCTSSLNLLRSISTTDCISQVDATSRRRNLAAANTNDSVIPPPTFDGQVKKYPQKIENLVNEISQLTLIEVSDLNELLRKKLNIKDTPMYAASPLSNVAGQTPAKSQEVAEEPEPIKSVKSSFNLKIVKFDEAKKVALIKEVKALSENMNLVQAKKIIESLPNIFRENVTKDEVEKIKAQLEKAGAVCEVE